MTLVRTPKEYRAAILEIELLWGSEPDTDEGRQLEAYLSAVDQYEVQNTHIPESQPIKA